MMKNCKFGKSLEGHRLSRLKSFGRLLTSIFFIWVGTMHFVRPGKFIQVMPEILPCKSELVYISGAFEILGGLGLLWSRTQQLAGKVLILLLLAVFPANINMAVNKIDLGFVPHWLLWVRLPVQFVLIYIVHKLSKPGRATVSKHP